MAVVTGILPHFYPRACTSCTRSWFVPLRCSHKSSLNWYAINSVTLLAKGIVHLADRLNNVSYSSYHSARKYWNSSQLSLAIQPLYDLVRRYPPDLSFLTTIHPIFVLVRSFHLNSYRSTHHPQSDLRHNPPFYAGPARALRPHNQHRHIPLRPALQRQPHISLHRRLCFRRTQAVVRSWRILWDLCEQPRRRTECNPAGSTEETEVGAVDLLRQGRKFSVLHKIVLIKWRSRCCAAFESPKIYTPAPQPDPQEHAVLCPYQRIPTPYRAPWGPPRQGTTPV